MVDFCVWVFLCARNLFVKKKINKLEIVLITSFYYTTDLRQLWALPWLLLIALLFHHIFTTSATVLSGHFLPTGVFYLTLLHWHFPYIHQGLTGGRQLFLEVFRALYWSSKHRPGPSVSLIHSNPQSSNSERFIFNLMLNHLLKYNI